MPSRFMDLPSEIRLKIYALSLKPTNPIALSSIIFNLKDQSATSLPSTNLLATNRQINREATEIFWAVNVFSVDHMTIFSLLKLFNPPRRRSNSSSASAGSQQFQGVSRGNVRSKLSEVKTIEYKLQCSLQKHPQLDPPGPRCVHVVFNSLSTLRDIVGLFCTPEQPPRNLKLILDAGSMPRDRAVEDDLLVDFEHKQLKKLNYKSEDPPWADGDTVDVIAGALKGLAMPHTVELMLATTLKELDDVSTNDTQERNGSNDNWKGKEVKNRELTATLLEKMGRRVGNTMTVHTKA